MARRPSSSSCCAALRLGMPRGVVGRKTRVVQDPALRSIRCDTFIGFRAQPLPCGSESAQGRRTIQVVTSEEKDFPLRKTLLWVSGALVVLFAVFGYIHYSSRFHRPPPEFFPVPEGPTRPGFITPAGWDINWGEIAMFAVGLLGFVVGSVIWLVRLKRYRAEKERKRTLGSSSPPVDPT